MITTILPTIPITLKKEIDGSDILSAIGGNGYDLLVLDPTIDVSSIKVLSNGLTTDVGNITLSLGIIPGGSGTATLFELNGFDCMTATNSEDVAKYGSTPAQDPSTIPGSAVNVTFSSDDATTTVTGTVQILIAYNKTV